MGKRDAEELAKAEERREKWEVGGGRVDRKDV